MCTVIISVCLLKRGGLKSGQAVTAVDEPYYDSAYGISAQTSSYPAKVAKDGMSITDTELELNAAYTTSEWSTVEINQNVAYDVLCSYNDSY